MKTTKTVGLAVAVVTLGLTGPAVATAAASTHHSTVVGHVYVNDNTSGANTIAAFNRQTNGTLTPEPGSPFAAGGAGLGAGTGSQGSLEVTPDGRYLLAVDAGSNQISVLRIHRDGSLGPVGGGPVSSHGIEPVSVAISRWGSRDLVYVANAGDGGANYTGFILDRWGQLRHLSGSTVPVPDGSVLGDVLFNTTGTVLAGTRVGTQLVDSFNVGRNGLLYAAAGSPFAAQGPGPIGSEFSPVRPNQLFVSNAHGGANNGTVSAFKVSRAGELTSIGASPFADNQTAPCWVEISHDGRFLFTSNTAVPSISRYSVASDGSLTLLGNKALSTTTEKGPVDLRLSPSGDTLYVVDSGSQAISSFAVHGGNLSELTSSPISVPAGTSPVGIVVD